MADSGGLYKGQGGRRAVPGQQGWQVTRHFAGNRTPEEVLRALIQAGRKAELIELEQQALARNASHKDWECTEELMKLTKGGKGLYCHCLPADISGVSCKEGECAASVFERYRLDTYAEAAHKPFVIAAMILLTRFPNPAKVLTQLMERERPRRLVLD